MIETPRLGADALERLNTCSAPQARVTLARCCGSARWVDAMLASRPFASAQALFAQADAIWGSLADSDYLEAFAHHPEIGAKPSQLRVEFAASADLSESEQAGAASAGEATLLELGRLNTAYRERFGYGFIVCATGKSGLEMLAILRQRLLNPPARELAVAAAEQAKITRLRLEKI